MRKLKRAWVPAVTVVFAVALAIGADVSAKGGATDAVTAVPMKVDRLDTAAADRILPKGATLEKVATGFTWVEGPVWVRGNLFFADITSNTIREWTPGAGVKIFDQPSGYQDAGAYGGPEPGSNGMTLDVRGRLTVAGHAQRDVYRFESIDPRGAATILADEYNGKRLNSPNDLVYKSDGSLYFTDPPYGLRTQGDQDKDKQLKVNGVFRIAHALEHKAGTPPDRSALQLVVSDLSRPNGIAFSPGEKYLYVDNSEPKKLWMRYTVHPDGALGDAKVLYDATADTRPGAPDGMKVDVEGNIYSAGPAGVWIFSPEGKPLATIVMPERTSNVAWGGPDRKTLYITASSSVYRIRLNVAGLPLVQSR